MKNKNLRARIFTTPFIGAVIAINFALLCTVIQNAELFVDSSEAIEGKPAPVSVRLPTNYFRITMLRNEHHYLTTTSSSCPSMVSRGTKLVPGTECTGLVRAYEQGRRPIRSTRLMGSFVFFLMVGFLLSGYMRREGMGRARWLRCQLTVLGLLLFIALFSKAVLLLTSLPFEILPVALVPLLAATFLGRRLSFGVALAASMVTSSLLNFDIQALFVFMAAGMASVLVVKNLQRHRIRMLVKSGAGAALASVTAIVLTTLLFSGTLDIYDDISEHVDPRYSIWIAGVIGGFGSSALAVIFYPLISIAIGEVSRGKLLDLQDLDHPLLKRLRERAPSTWEHSRAMANLAEASAHAIGGDAMLVRVGAYFHDVGKSYKPEFFIENQHGENPHDQLNPYDSARAIFQHVIEGTRLLRMERVPEDVIEFAYSHHGTGLLEYFWHKNLAEGNTEKFIESDFSYCGHKPTTKESAILMIVDAVEAAARTVDEPDKAKFETLLQRIVFGKMAQGQLDESGLSIHELRTVINTILDTLVSMYHARIKYPWQTEDTGSFSLEKVDTTSSQEAQSDRETQNGKEASTAENASSDSVATSNSEKDAPVVKVTPTSVKNTEPPATHTPVVIDDEPTTYTGPAPAPPHDDDGPPAVTASSTGSSVVLSSPKDSKK